MEVWVELKPDAAGAAGDRTAVVEVKIKGGDIATAAVHGYAGTRTLVAAPGTLFSGTVVQAGGLARGYVAITNTGTLPVRLNAPVITGANAGDYIIGLLPRRVLDPGQTEIIEVTYLPQGVGESSAQLEFGGNATNGVQVVKLSGEATSGTIKVDDPSEASQNQAIPGEEMGRSTSARGTGQLMFSSIAPNPARESVDIAVILPQTGQIDLTLHTSNGALVKVIHQGELEAGSQLFRVNLEEVASGVYYCTLRQNGRVITQPVNIVR